jgi:D-glycero-D-manno-heptose 1,7-bisphosphate phosphatase
MLAILITNQRWLSEPTVHADAYFAVDARLRQSLAAHGAWLDACYVCPHALNECGCRKPKPGMLLRAAEDLKIDLRSSFVVGDSITDVQAGLAVGARTSLIDQAGDSGHRSGAHFVARSVAEAVNWVLDEAARSVPQAHRR